VAGGGLAPGPRHECRHTRPHGLSDLVREAHGTDYGTYDPRWISVYDADERQARTYRVGRVFVAGDTAHMHSPVGGQGMNLGMQDAENLAALIRPDGYVAAAWRTADAAHLAAALPPVLTEECGPRTHTPPDSPVPHGPDGSC
jgi:2-polyprenyl-6-methoxyphenol hydroxylase-like FAD-dependent oxidoreductase